MSVSRTVPEGTATRRTQRSRWGVAVGPGMIVGLIATAGLVVSMFLAWQSRGVHASDIPAAFLWDKHATGSPSLLVYLIPLAVLMGIGSVMRGGSALRGLAGLLTIVVVGLYAYQLHEITKALHVSFSDTIDAGFYVAAIAGVVGLISAFVPTTVPSRRVEQEERYDTVE